MFFIKIMILLRLQLSSKFPTPTKTTLEICMDNLLCNKILTGSDAAKSAGCFARRNQI